MSTTRDHADPYADAGVDIDAGHEAVERMRRHLARTAVGASLVTMPGGFAGGVALDAADMRQPVLVSGADGVGTKVLVAARAGRFDTIGIDLVAMCVNDIAVYGARPLFMLDYIATGVVEPDAIEQLVAGVADGCVEAGCALLGGETAEMPGMYAAGHADVAGFAVGVVDRMRIPQPHATVRAGDAVVGFASSGLHANGFSLARRLLIEGDDPLPLDSPAPGLDRPLVDELLTPTRIYSTLGQQLVDLPGVRGMAHITGGGLYDNLGRILPDDVDAELDAGTWLVPAIFGLLRARGDLDWRTCHRVFNMGIGFVVVVAPSSAAAALHTADRLGFGAWRIGEVVPGHGDVTVIGDAAHSGTVGS